jgi:hypothetical protein
MMGKFLLSLTASVFVLSLLVFANNAFSKSAPTNKPTPPNEVCYVFNNFCTDGIRMEITPGSRVVSGVYRQCVDGRSPGSSSADSLMVGTIQDVPVGNTFPYEFMSFSTQLGPYETLTQINLTGSLATGNFGGDAGNKAAQCWMNLVFEDNAMTTGAAIGACGNFSGNVDSNNLITSLRDQFAEGIHRIPCSEFPLNNPEECEWAPCSCQDFLNRCNVD